MTDIADTALRTCRGGPDHVALLRALVERGASDLHCKAGSPPAMRVRASCRDIDHPVLGRAFTPESVALLAQSLLTTDQQQALAPRRLGGGHPRRTRASAASGSPCSASAARCAVVVHAVPQQVRPLEELGLPSSVATLASAERGLVLVASPVGNGATTTLAAMVDHVNRTRACHVVTVEDPAEVLHRDDRSLVSQLEVPTDVANLADGVRSASRLDADVVTISDIADREVALAALDAVGRGRLVLATIGGNTVRTVMDGFLELFTFEERPNVRQSLARSLAGVIVQRLLTGTDGRLLPVAEVLVSTPKIQAVLADESPHRRAPARCSPTASSTACRPWTSRSATRSAPVAIAEGVALAAATDAEELRIELLRS